ncbi:KAP family P-loop domain-containing protein [Burkholderia sp. WP9]|uniref:KAP family P-loop NTPase fold protein n=1 Tax=Burkholderia sp. WP9 TaxID=1500263 RepID=UPI00089AB8B2|nr:P-loop NTPase fold protein [Burkholderia sp. WP9]SED79529.1 KAP family P-loop domain-containing protein [Burkholderia sp. WP9]
MINKARQTFGDDRAKKNPWEEDRLGVAPIAKRLAHVIQTLDAPYGYVIGINGVWGHGKSTLLNFTCAFLDKHNEEARSDDEKVSVIEFRPWMVSGHQDLVSAFFKILTESVGPRENWLKRFLRKRLKQVGGSSDAVMDAMAKVAVAADIGVTKGAATAVVNIVKRPLKAKIDEFLQDESLQSAHEGLVEQLQKAGRKFLVTIDDIDRLSEDEVKSIMQLVKTVGQLPNVVYLLSYDRTKISEAFDEQEDNSSPRYSEKIIQHEIELPKPSKRSLLLILDGEISFMMGTAQPDESRWFTLTSRGIRRWIDKPRDVLRLANAVKFAWPALEGEIDPVDLLIMEGLRLFDTDAFNWIRDNRDFLFRDGNYRFQDTSARKPVVERFTNSIGSREDKDQILDVMSVLFPSLAELIANKGFYHSEAYHSIASRRGIASEAGYDAYFALTPSSDAIPKRVVDEVVSGVASDAQLISIINSYVGKRSTSGAPMISEFLGELRHRYDAVQPPAVSQPLVSALFAKADAILAEPISNDLFSLSPSSGLLFLVDKILRLAGTTEAPELLKSVFGDTTSLAFSADVFVDIGRDLFIFPGDESAKREPPLVDKDSFEELGAILLQRIIQAASDGSLESAPHFWNLIRTWTHYDKSDKPKLWMSQRMMDNPLFMLKTAQGLLGYSASPKGKSYHFTERPDTTLYDFDVIHDAAQRHLQTAKLNDDARRQLEALREGADRMRCEKFNSDMPSTG